MCDIFMNSKTATNFYFKRFEKLLSYMLKAGILVGTESCAKGLPLLYS
jgi:hypothetical protein